jgi:hypothetical protein
MRFIKICTFFALAALLQLSCVKSKDINFVSQSTPTINTVDFPNQQESAVLDISPTPVLRTFYVELNSSDNSYPASDITIAKDASALPAGYVYLPDSSYQLLNTTATVDPKSHLAAFQVKLFSNKISLAYSYGLGFSITSASGGVTIADNKKKDALLVGVKNIYDGVYNTRGYALRAGDAALTGYFTDVEFGLITFSATSNDFDHLQVWGDGVSGVGIGIPRITTDPTTNLVTVTSSGGATNYPGYNNHYDPATKTFYLGFTWGAGPAARAAFDTMVYVRPR